MIEAALRHDVSRAGVQGVVLPECKYSSRPQALVYVSKRDGSILWSNVMKHAIGIDEVEIPLWRIISQRGEFICCVIMRAIGDIQRFRGDIEAKHRLETQNALKYRDGVSRTASVVERRKWGLSEFFETLGKKCDATLCKEALVFSRDRERLIQVLVVSLGITVKPRGHLRRIPRTLRKKLAKIVCAPSVRHSAAGMTICSVFE